MRSRRGIVRSGLADQVYEALRDQILDLDYEPGERLVIDQIARDFGVSQTPVRDALARLAGEGFIDQEAFRGFTVLAVPSPDEIAQSFEARAAIETAAIRLGYERAQPAQLEELRELQARIATQQYGARSKGFSPFVRLNQQFHLVLAGTSQNAYLVDALRSLNHDALIARTMYGRGVPDIRNIVEEHEAILDALERRDVDAAEAAVRRHIEDGAQRILTFRAKTASD